MSTIRYLYKIVPSTNPPPSPLPEVLPLSSLDAASGFIHLSTAVQIPGTLKHFFADEPRVYILRLDFDALKKHIKWEDPKAEVCGERGDEGVFPHLYNDGRLGKNEVESQYTLENDETGWDEALKNSSWLIY